MTIYPLQFEPQFKHRIWGGNQLAHLFPDYLDPATTSQIGEAWLVGDANVITNGDYAGTTLRDLYHQHPELFGDVTQTEKEFPLLIKFLDAKEYLSVQVHPDDNYARANDGEPRGKSEVWLVMNVEPQAGLIHGFKVAQTIESIQTAIAEKRLPELLNRLEVQAGDVIMNQPGAIHALGAGILIYELQQSSDLTYRFYDWDRLQPDGTPRQLHLEKSLAVAHLDPLPQHSVVPIALDTNRSMFAACACFVGELVQAPAHEDTQQRQFHILTCLEGDGIIVTAMHRMAFKRGESILMPAPMGAYQIEGNCRYVKAYVPHLLDDVVRPLQALGCSPSEILQLEAAHTRGTSALAPLLD